MSIRAADFTCTFREGETIWTEAAKNSASRRFLASLDARDSCAKRNGLIPNGRLPRTSDRRLAKQSGVPKNARRPPGQGDGYVH